MDYIITLKSCNDFFDAILIIYQLKSLMIWEKEGSSVLLQEIKNLNNYYESGCLCFSDLFLWPIFYITYNFIIPKPPLTFCAQRLRTHAATLVQCRQVNTVSTQTDWSFEVLSNSLDAAFLSRYYYYGNLEI